MSEKMQETEQKITKNCAKFKKIYFSAIKAFDIIAEGKSILNELKLGSNPENLLKNGHVKINPKQIQEITNLLTEFKKTFNFINRKKSIKIINKKINKKKRLNKTNNDQFYTKKLFELVKNEKIFSNHKDQMLNNDNKSERLKIKDSIAIEEVQQRNLEIEKLNSNIFELKELVEYGKVLSKLIELRSKNRVASLNDTSLVNSKKLNDLIQMIENKQAKYQTKKKSLKEQVNAFNNSLNSDTTNFNKNLKQIEFAIKKNLFGPIVDEENIKKLSYFELFYRQADISVNNLVMIRQEWDNFLSSSLNAQPIPIQWVSLDEPKDNEWSQFITKT